MDELDYDYKAHARKDNEGLAVRFFMDAVQDESASVNAGRPIFRDTEMIEKRVRGNRNDIVIRPVNDNDKREFRDLYRQFKEDVEQTGQSGTPLEQWPPITKSLCLELKHMGFHTVEQLAGASDSVCGKMAGLQTFKQKAIAFLEVSKNSSAPIEQLSARVTDLVNQVETLMAQNQRLSAELAAHTAKV